MEPYYRPDCAYDLHAMSQFKSHKKLIFPFISPFDKGLGSLRENEGTFLSGICR